MCLSRLSIGVPGYHIGYALYKVKNIMRYIGNSYGYQHQSKCNKGDYYSGNGQIAWAFYYAGYAKTEARSP